MLRAILHPVDALLGVLARATVRGTLVTIAVMLAAVAVGIGLAFLDYEFQMYLTLLAITIVGAAWYVPRAVRKEPTVTVAMLGAALALKIVGSLARYFLLGSLYQKGDALVFHEAGVKTFEMVRRLDFSFVEQPYLGTGFMEDLTGLLYAAIGPSMLGAYLVFAVLAFVGTWCFYRAHRIAFPNGDARLFFIFLFFLPTMFFWPSSLGKDAIAVFALGLATLGTARLLRGFSAAAAVQLVFGLGVAFLVRPPLAVMLLAAGGIGLLIHPGRMSEPLARPTSWLLIAPVLAVGLFFSLQWAANFENLDSVDTAVREYGAAQERLETGGGEFETALPSGPVDVGKMVVTVLFRPFPWEVELGPALFAGLEGFGLLMIVLVRFMPALRAMRLWRGGMVVTALLMAVFLIVPLGAFSNFGLLARQRAQLLPFVFLLLTAVRRPRVAEPAPVAQTRAAAPVAA